MAALVNILSFFLIFEQKGSVSFGIYEVHKSLTVPGWIVLIALSLALIFGTIRLAKKIVSKSKLK